MIALIIVLVLAVIVAGGALYGRKGIKEKGAADLSTLQIEAKERNDQLLADYQAEVDEYMALISTKEGNKAWPEAASEGWDVLDLTTYPLERPGMTTVRREQAMFGGLLLVNEWHSRPEDFREPLRSGSGATENRNWKN